MPISVISTSIGFYGILMINICFLVGYYFWCMLNNYGRYFGWWRGFISISIWKLFTNQVLILGDHIHFIIRKKFTVLASSFWVNAVRYMASAFYVNIN